MSTHHRSGLRFRPAASFVLFAAFLGVLWLAGGASRADASGQVIVRAAAWGALVVALLMGERPSLRGVAPVLIIVGAAAMLALLQLVPLPPAIWQALPGRAVLSEAAAASAQAQPWRPWSIVPAATANAAASLIVPLTIALLAAGLNARDRSWVPGVLLGLIAASMVAGMLQFSGAGLANPFVNDTPGDVTGMFANRNHFALSLALGCVLAPVWAFLGGRRPQWRGPVALGLVLLFTLTILASGSRAGMAVGALALGLGLAIVRRAVRREVRGAPRWAFPALIAAVVGIFVLFVLISVAADRAESISRVVAIDPGADMRTRGLPTVLAMIWTYFPAGTGFGSFDPLFRIHEPFGLLKFTYFNHAHDDVLEIVLDGGLPALLLLAGALGWWAWASVRTWRAGPGPEQMLPRAGSAMLLLVLIASLVDYPARTPMIMAMMAIAGMWLGGADRPRAAALPGTDPPL